ncbi:hypothetical protein COCON_G00010830 [Conger conger]|uniref:Uncharacterized protein n=1 Tax=Conger conger TaxID=82655 RepID=A0A9Q1E2L3_CONCO|nr:hypothetical protein COCON_G00010830 [Conger conger]
MIGAGGCLRSVASTAKAVVFFPFLCHRRFLCPHLHSQWESLAGEGAAAPDCFPWCPQAFTRTSRWKPLEPPAQPTDIAKPLRAGVCIVPASRPGALWLLTKKTWLGFTPIP